MLKDLKWEQEQKTLEQWRLVLLEAADSLDKNGWTQGATMGRDGSRCMVAAISMASRADYGMVTATRAITALRKHLGVQGTSDLVSWNDRFWRTRRQVTKALRAAAKEGATC